MKKFGLLKILGRSACIVASSYAEFGGTLIEVDELEERFKGEMSQIKAKVEDRISSVENKVSDLHAMMKKLLENQIAASEAKESVGKTTSSVYRRRDDEVEIMEEQGERYEGRHGVRACLIIYIEDGTIDM
ncbi:hypothetical protein M5K25_021982 [Dendrobium thyrsiflorum]|uniref:Uncharacterized protein n=1 Tax=Dendrobium thyrsiflorum TaxID=117978 RepID=A0ABD0UB64_DENTH